MAKNAIYKLIIRYFLVAFFAIPALILFYNPTF